MMHPQAPRDETERRTAGQVSPGRSARASDDRFDQRNGTRTPTASVHTLHAFGRRGDQIESRQPSLLRRMVLSMIRFVVTLLIGIGGTLAWESYGDAVKGIVAVQAPALARLLPPSGWPAAASPNLAQPPAYNLETLRLNIEQLAARQDLMAQSFATLLAIEMDIRQKMAFTPPSGATLVQPAPVQQNRLMQSRARSSAVQ